MTRDIGRLDDATLRAVMYLRGVRIAEQRTTCRSHASAVGASVIREYADIGRSGATMDRPGLRWLLEALKTTDDIDCVIVSAEATLSRRIADYLYLFREIEVAGARLVVVQGSSIPSLLMTVRGEAIS